MTFNSEEKMKEDNLMVGNLEEKDEKENDSY